MNDKGKQTTKTMEKFWEFHGLDSAVILDSEPAQLPKDDPAATIDDRTNRGE